MNNKIYCTYCKEEITEEETSVYILDVGYFHYNENEPLKNCYFVDEDIFTMDV